MPSHPRISSYTPGMHTHLSILTFDAVGSYLLACFVRHVFVLSLCQNKGTDFWHWGRGLCWVAMRWNTVTSTTMDEQLQVRAFNWMYIRTCLCNYENVKIGLLRERAALGQYNPVTLACVFKTDTCTYIAIA